VTRLKLLRTVRRRASRRVRRATSRARLLPSFLIIGAQRAGTTSLYDYLCRHPDVAGPTVPKGEVWWAKELHFFDDGYERGVDWYRAWFPLAASRVLARRRGRDLVAGEATPSYMFHPQAPARVAATIPDARLIALLRDPVERAYSHYQMMVRMGREQLSFEDAVEAEPERLAAEQQRRDADPTYKSPDYRHFAYISRGLYAEQLERWLEHFPRERLLVVASEDLGARPEEVYVAVLAFLGLREWPLRDVTFRNRASYSPIDPALRARLEERFAEPNARLRRLLGRDFAWGTHARVEGPARASADA
jgi:hypothetical protein